MSYGETTVALNWNEIVIRGQKQTFTVIFFFLLIVSIEEDNHNLSLIYSFFLHCFFQIACEGIKDYYPEFADVRTVVTTATSFTISGLFPGTKYKFSVRSTSRCGVSDNSTVLSVETQATGE